MVPITSTPQTPGRRSHRLWTVSVVIPTLNEAANIGARLDELTHMQGVQQVVVVDGGSADETRDVVRRFASVVLLQTEAGRARQMNAGAARASGDVLLFLHADVQLPGDAIDRVLDALRNPDIEAGAFRTWTVPGPGRDRWWAPLLHLADLRSRYSKVPYGDQALFVRTSVFESLGGYSEDLLMEDLELALRLLKRGGLTTLRTSVRVSGRRFMARPVYYTMLVNVLPLLYRLGLPARLLARLYGNPR